MCMLCGSFFVLLYFFFWPLCCLFFFDLQGLIRDRPFNLKGGLWFFASFRIFFRSTRELEFFFQSLTLGYMTKTLNQIIIFFLHQNQNIFFSNIGNQNIFLEKNHNPPFKLIGRSLTPLVSSNFSYNFIFW